MDKLLDRFFNYVSFDTQSKANVKHVPSTDGQLKLARALQQEMIALGFERVSLSEHGCVMGTAGQRRAGAGGRFYRPSGYLAGFQRQTRQSADRRELSRRRHRAGHRR